MASAERVYRRDATPRTVDAQATANQRGFSTLHTTERITAAKHETAISLDCWLRGQVRWRSHHKQIFSDSSTKHASTENHILVNSLQAPEFPENPFEGRPTPTCIMDRIRQTASR